LGKTTIERDFLEKKARELGSSNNYSLVEPELEEITIARQCELLDIKRSSYYYRSKQIVGEEISVFYEW